MVDYEHLTKLSDILTNIQLIYGLRTVDNERLTEDMGHIFSKFITLQYQYLEMHVYTVLYSIIFSQKQMMFGQNWQQWA